MLMQGGRPDGAGRVAQHLARSVAYHKRWWADVQHGCWHAPQSFGSGAHPKPNMLGSKQRVWTHSSPLMGSDTLFEPNTQLRFFF